MTDPSASYDNVPYQSFAFAQSHPSHLAAIAALFGMDPAAPSGARVLEVGCAGGGNLIPLAVAHPGGEFVGVDISAVQIAQARECAEALGLKNVTLLAMGLEDLDDATTGGPFDYIIAHGLYSWVAAPVREQFMALCGRLLKPQGVAFISFNILPGSLARCTLRDMVMYHTRKAPDLATRINHTRGFCALLGEAFENRDDGIARMMMAELAHVAGNGDFYIAHEYLEDTNEPCYFHEFMAHSRRHGLQFLADAEMQTMAAGDIPAPVRNRMRAMSSDVEEAEQYMDFLRNRAFRQTLLCRADVPLKRTISTDVVFRFHFASSLNPVPGEAGAETDEFTDSDGTAFGVPDPLARAALLELRAAWPATVSFEDLFNRAADRAGQTASDAGAATLVRSLLMCYSVSRAMEFHLYPPEFHLAVSAYPKASALARWQAPRTNTNTITNLRHENLVLSPEDRAFLHKVDGTRSVETLAKEAANVQDVLETFARLALLVS